MGLQSLVGACVALLALAPPVAAQPVPAPAPTPAVAASPIPASVFAERPTLGGLALSPDGTRIAAIDSGGGGTRLVIFEADAKVRKPRYYPLGGFPLLDVEWAGPGRMLVTSGANIGLFGIPVPFRRITILDVATGAVRPLDPGNASVFGGEILYIDPKGEWVLLAAQKSLGGTPWVWRIDLATGQATIVEKARSNVWNWFADSAGVVRAGIAYDEDHWTMWYRDAPGVPLAKVRSGLAKGMAGSVDSVYFFPGAGGGAIVTNAGSDRFGAYRFDLRTGEIGEAIYAHPRVDVTAIVADPVTRGIAGVSYEDERSRTEWIDPAMRAVQARLDKAFPGADSTVLSRSADGNRLLIWSGGAADPGTFYLFDQAARRLEAIAQPFEKLADMKLAPVAPVHYPARDGMAIPGYLTLPPGRPERGLPLVVMPHGGPFVRDSWRYDPYVQFLASRGYAVLQPNFRGSTGYGRRFVEAGYGQWGRKMQDDVDDGIDWLAARGTIDPKRVCVMGASYGGYVALWGAIRNPERYRCAVSLSGVTDLPGMLRFDRKSFNAPRYFRQWESKVRGERETDLLALSPLAQAARMTVPVLIAHGGRDDNVPPEQMRKMVAALSVRPKPASEVVTVLYADEGHGLSEPKNAIDFFTRLEAFLGKYNPADTGPAAK